MGLLITLILGVFVLAGAAIAGFTKNAEWIRELSIAVALGAMVMLLVNDLVPEAIEGRENGRTSVDLVPLESARPSPQVPQIASSLFESQTSPDPDSTETSSPEPTETPEPTPTPTAAPTSTPEHEVLEYVPVAVRSDPTPTPTPSPVPTPTPYLTPDPDSMTFEEDEE